MTDPIAKAFLSYAHLDDDRESGRILRLADHIRNEFELLTGSTIQIFTDRAEILWGDDWRERLDEALQETTFFIPILTPTYFNRDECRKEMKQFTTSARGLGLNKLLLSIRYIPVPDLRDDSVDELKSKAARMQFEAWDRLRLVAEDSPEHRQAINRLAVRLVQLTQDLETDSDGGSAAIGSAALVASPSVPGQWLREDQDLLEREPTPRADLEDDEPGVIDVLADAEPALEAWTATLTQIPEATTAFSEKVQAAADAMNVANSMPNSFARKITIARSLAADVQPDLERLEELSRDYSEQLQRVDTTFRMIYEIASEATGDDDRAQIASFNVQIRGLIDSAGQAMSSVITAADTARDNARLSKDLRPVLRRFETAMRNIADGSTLISTWGDLIERYEERS